MLAMALFSIENISDENVLNDCGKIVKNVFVSTLWWTNYVIAALFVKNLEHSLFSVSLLKFLVDFLADICSY